MNTRVKIHISKLGKAPLSYDYQYFMAGTLSFRQQGLELEFEKPPAEGKPVRHYCFSYIRYDALPPNSRLKRSNTGLQFETGHFVLSSPDALFLEGLGAELLDKPNFFLGGVEMRVDQITRLPEPDFSKGRSFFKTLSPLYIRTTRDQGGRTVEWELYPTNRKFYDNIHLQLLSGFENYFGRAPEKKQFQLRTMGKFKAKRHTINGRKCRASLLSFQLNADPGLMKFGYDMGFGEATDQGFGCVEVLARRKAEQRAQQKPGRKKKANGEKKPEPAGTEKKEDRAEE